MKLYSSTDTCWPSLHIAAHEADIQLELVRVGNGKSPHVPEGGKRIEGLKVVS